MSDPKNKKKYKKRPGTDLSGRCPEDREWMEGFVQTMGELRSLVESMDYYAAAKAFLRYLRDRKDMDGAEHVAPKVQYGTPLGNLLNDRTVSILERAGYLTAGAVMQATDEELIAVNQISKLTLKRIRKVLPCRNSQLPTHEPIVGLYASEALVTEGSDARRQRIRQLLKDAKNGDRG